MKNCVSKHRTVRWLLLGVSLCASLSAGACSWIEAEFSTLDRLPRAWSAAPDAPPSALAVPK